MTSEYLLSIFLLKETKTKDRDYDKGQNLEPRNSVITNIIPMWLCGSFSFVFIHLKKLII